MIKKNLLIYSAFIFIFIIQNLSANEIISRHLYNVGDQVKYKIDRILPNESSYITESNLINIIEDKRFGMLRIAQALIREYLID